MALSLRKKRGTGGGPNIPTASMGDIAFLIIIFFMTTSIFARDKGLKIVLPEKGEDTKVPPEMILQVDVNQGGNVLITFTEPVTKAKQVTFIKTIPEVREQVMMRLSQNPQLAISLRVSRGAPYSTMIDVFDQLKLSNAQRISLTPVKGEEGAGGPQ